MNAGSTFLPRSWRHHVSNIRGVTKDQASFTNTHDGYYCLIRGNRGSLRDRGSLSVIDNSPCHHPTKSTTSLMNLCPANCDSLMPQLHRAGRPNNYEAKRLFCILQASPSIRYEHLASRCHRLSYPRLTLVNVLSCAFRRLRLHLYVEITTRHNTCCT